MSKTISIVHKWYFGPMDLFYYVLIFRIKLTEIKFVYHGCVNYLLLCFMNLYSCAKVIQYCFKMLFKYSIIVKLKNI